MDDPNITMEEYIRLEEEKARRRGQVYNWEKVTYGKIWYDKDVHYLRSFEKEFPAIILRKSSQPLPAMYALTSDFSPEPTVKNGQPQYHYRGIHQTSIGECSKFGVTTVNWKSDTYAIVLDNTITPREALSREPTVSPLNDNKIDFRISFDESDDEDYTMKHHCFDKAFVDLGESMSVMPFSTYTNLVLGVLSHTRLTIELADKTIKQPRGIPENVLVRIGKFVFRIDFIILDIPEDDDVPLILGLPFLSTAHVKIDVFKRKVTLRVGEEKLVFKSIKPASIMIKRAFMDE
ncbi:hypothetical protein Tco_0644141 [Tanacetum coccineum]